MPCSHHPVSSRIPCDQRATRVSLALEGRRAEQAAAAVRHSGHTRQSIAPSAVDGHSERSQLQLQRTDGNKDRRRRRDGCMKALHCSRERARYHPCPTRSRRESASTAAAASATVSVVRVRVEAMSERGCVCCVCGVRTCSSRGRSQLEPLVQRERRAVQHRKQQRETRHNTVHTKADARTAHNGCDSAKSDAV